MGLGQYFKESDSSSGDGERDSDGDDDDEDPDETRERGAALCVLVVPGGTFFEYDHEEKEELYVVCKCDHGHGNACRRQRTFLGRKNNRGSLAQGRPLGYLYAGLKKGACPDCNSKGAHKKIKVTRQERETARTEFALIAGAAALLEDERERRPGEPEEPQGQP